MSTADTIEVPSPALSQSASDEVLECGDAVCVVDASFTVVRVNAAQERISRLPREQTLGHSFWTLWPELAAPDSPFGAAYRRCMSERVSVDVEDYYAPLDLWTAVRAVPLRDGGLAIYFRDTTDQRRAERSLRDALREADEERRRLLEALGATTAEPPTATHAEAAARASNARFQLLVEHAPVAIAMLDHEMRYLAHSRRYLEDFRLPAKSLVGRSHYEVFPEIPARWREIHRRCLEGATERSDLDRFERADGAVDWLRWETVPWRDASGAIGGIVLFSEDLTPLKAVEDKLADQRQLLASIIDGTPSLIAAFDGDTRILFVNEATARFHGRPKESFVGEFPTWGLAPADAARVLEHHREVRARGEALISEQRAEVGGETRTVLAARYPLRDARGVIRGTATIATDITAQKRVEAELRASEARAREALAALERARENARITEERLRQSQKMESIGQLAGGVAHDFNNLLTIILGSSELLLAELKQGDPLREEAVEIVKAGHRAAELTRQLLAFSRRQVLEPRRVDLNALIRGAERMLQRLIPEDVELNLVLAPTIEACLVDPGQMEQVLLNLVVNSRDAMPDGGHILIETANVLLDAAYAQEHPEVQPGEYVRLTVSDTGVGMTPQVVSHLFEPFFTTKEVGRGTGLGLSTVYGIVRQSGGHIWVYSEPGQGTVFKIYLPVVREASATRPDTTALHAPRRGKETVLLVEDDDAVRAAVASMLRRAGYHVIPASNGGEALLVCEQHGGAIDLLLTDVVMPKLNGRKVALRLQQIRPTLRVLFMSGYTENAIVHHGVLDSGLDFIPKPITSEPLLAKVREVLDRPEVVRVPESALHGDVPPGGSEKL